MLLTPGLVGLTVFFFSSGATPNFIGVSSAAFQLFFCCLFSQVLIELALLFFVCFFRAITSRFSLVFLTARHSFGGLAGLGCQSNTSDYFTGPAFDRAAQFVTILSSSRVLFIGEVVPEVSAWRSLSPRGHWKGTVGAENNKMVTRQVLQDTILHTVMHNCTGV